MPSLFQPNDITNLSLNSTTKALKQYKRIHYPTKPTKQVWKPIVKPLTDNIEQTTVDVTSSPSDLSATDDSDSDNDSDSDTLYDEIKEEDILKIRLIHRNEYITTKDGWIYKERIKPIPACKVAAPTVVNGQNIDTSNPLLQKRNMYTMTQNGALSHQTTNCARLDLFYGGFVRGASENHNHFHELLQSSWNEHAEDTISLLLHSRDCRNGKGEKQVSIDAMLWLRTYKPATYLLNLATFINYGYFKDLLALASMVIQQGLPTLGIHNECIELELLAEILKYDYEKVLKWEEKEAMKTEKELDKSKHQHMDVATDHDSSLKNDEIDEDWIDVTQVLIQEQKEEEEEKKCMNQPTCDTPVVMTAVPRSWSTVFAVTSAATATHASAAHNSMPSTVSSSINPFDSTIAAILPSQLPHCFITLAGKWAPSEGKKYDRDCHLANRLANLMFPEQTNIQVLYRKCLSKLRMHIDIVERYICTKQWNHINFSMVPARAHHLLKRAFQKHDDSRYQLYLTLVQQGKSKICTTGIQPHELVQQYLNGHKYNRTLELQWCTLVNCIRKKGTFKETIALVDVSGSMMCSFGGISKIGTRPLDVAIALGLLVSELSTGAYHNRVLTFDDKPTWHHIKGATLRERVANLSQAKWGGSTNILLAFQQILSFARAKGVNNAALPKTLFIFSDMQFNYADHTFNTTTYEHMKRQYSNYGYIIPNLVFWNLNGRINRDFPVKMDTPGVALISGFSAELLQLFLSGESLDPLSIMFAAINQYKQKVKIDEMER